MNQDMILYYQERAKEYERIYAKPERQEDIKAAAEIVKRLFDGKNVLEIACGTGFWTQFIAETAKSILATDINQTVIEIAKAKQLKEPSVSFEVADMFKNHKNRYESLFGGFIFSHILKQERRTFFENLVSLSEKGAEIVLMDNLYVEGSNHPITDTDDFGNTFQTRKLDDGSTHRVLKNFPDEQELRDTISDFTDDVSYNRLNYFWILSFRLKI